MSQKSVPDPTLSPPLTWRTTESQEDVSWSEALTPIVLGLGVVVLLVSAIFVPVAAIGYGDCVTRTLCDEQDFWAGVFRSQAVLLFGWPVLALALAVIARRRRVVWLLFAAVCGLVLVAGAVPAVNGLSNTEPRLFEFALPVVSSGFAAWLPAAALLTLGGALAWNGARLRAARGQAGHHQADDQENRHVVPR